MAAEQALQEAGVTEPQDLPPLPEGRFAGRLAFADRVRLALFTAARQGWSSLLLSDPDFADWPLGERPVIEALNAWAGRGRQLQLLARDYTSLRLQHPRFVQWRVTWSHLVEAQQCAGTAAADLPSAIWSPVWAMERADLPRCTGRSGADPALRVALRERLDRVWQQGAPGFPATTLGL